MATKHIYLIRHGETESNVGGFYQSPEVPLSEKGKKGAQAVAERCEHIDIDVVVTSPFMRAQQTAQQITAHISKPLVEFPHAHEVLNAQSMWGKHFESPESVAYEHERKTGFLNPEWNFDKAENYFDVSKRVESCIQMLEQSEYNNIALVSHGNFLRFLIARLLLEKQPDVEPNMAIYRSLSRMSNVAITEFTFEKGKWELFTWNDHAHFAE